MSPINLIYIFFLLPTIILLSDTSIKSALKVPIKFLSESIPRYRPLNGGVDFINGTTFGIEITLGSNNQVLDVALDTGSADLWVPIKGIVERDNKNFSHYYDPSTSTTAKIQKNSFTITYGTGQVKGMLYEDILSFYSDTPYPIIFGAANKSQSLSSGIMGLAQKYDNPDHSPIWVMKNKGLISSTGFSFKFDQDTKKMDMFIGTEHEDFSKKDTAFCPMLDSTYYDKYLWTCKLYSMSIVSNGLNITSKAGFRVLFDTGTNVISLPLSLAVGLKKGLYRMGCTIQKIQGSYYLTCNDTIKLEDLPKLYIEVGNYYLEIGTYLYSRRKYVGMKDYIKILDFKFENTTVPIIGLGFFKTFHTRFDGENRVLKFSPGKTQNVLKSWTKPKGDQPEDIRFVTLEELNGPDVPEEEPEPEPEKKNEEDEEDDEGDDGGSTGIIIFVVILCLVLAGVGGFFVYRKFKKKNSIEDINNDRILI